MQRVYSPLEFGISQTFEAKHSSSPTLFVQMITYPYIDESEGVVAQWFDLQPEQSGDRARY